MFEYLKDYRVILVTGPQRSGTTICTQMISRDTGHLLLHESIIANDSIYLFRSVIAHGRLVLQCPGVSAFVHHVGNNDDIAVVMMKRKIEDIIASQERINWDGEVVELSKYWTETGPIAKVKYDVWEMQKQYIKHPYEVEYESLKEHPLWVPKNARVNFGPHQTKVKEL